ncbi:hypothetical protein IW262DRAFT_1298327 [Armillaria fumosa]|nr:hypothetical protein IW262DRAFT_1298327 [Armillaria fumosa]
MSALPHTYYAAEIPLVSSCSELVMMEFSSYRITSLCEIIFQKERLIIRDTGFSPFQQWYLDARSVNTPQRTIAWKKDRPFHPENLFFRTIDTDRLLPMSLASFRVQLYATKDWCDAFQRDEEKEKWFTDVILALMHPILIFRNICDYAGGDIHII